MSRLLGIAEGVNPNNVVSMDVGELPRLAAQSSTVFVSGVFGWGFDARTVAAAVAEVEASDAPVVRVIVDSPGGDVTGLHEAAAAIRACSKPVHVYAYECLSAAYWVLSGATSITLAPEGSAGSIGAVVFYAEQGMNVLVSEQSPKKAEAEEELQEHLNAICDLFITDVAAGRGVTSEYIRGNFGEGAALTAQRALAVGLVDHVGTLDEFLTNGVDTMSVQNKTNAQAPVATTPVAAAPVAAAPVATTPAATAPVATAPVATAPVATAPVAPAIDIEAVRREAVTQERERVAALQALAKPYEGTAAQAYVAEQVAALVGDPDMTVAKASETLVQALGVWVGDNAQSFAGGRRAAAAIAAGMGTPGGDPSEADLQTQTLCKAAKGLR